MAFHVIANPADAANPANDRLYAQQMEHAARVDEREEFKTVVVTVKGGAKVNVKYALDSHYVFAVFAENKPHQALDKPEWDALAKDALEKFAAMNGRTIKFGPRAEDGQHYNMMVELDRAVEWRASTLATFKKQREEREAAEARVAELKRLGIDPSVLAANNGPYQPIGR